VNFLFSSSTPNSFTSSLSSQYLFVLDITASELAGVHHGVATGGHPSDHGVVEELLRVSKITHAEGIEQGSSQSSESTRSLLVEFAGIGETEPASISNRRRRKSEKNRGESANLDNPC
jgi:hypothetical protein